MNPERIHGVCPHDCPDTCSFITEVKDGRAVNFYADATHPVTDNWLCAKVRPYLDFVYHPDRLTTPLRRRGPKGGGQWAEISWEEAIGEIGARWREIVERYGAAAILPYSYSGTLGMVQMGVASGRFWNRLGASRLERAICGAAAEFAVEMTLGRRWSPAYETVTDSKVIIVWGHNPVSTAPHFMPHLAAARRGGTQLVVIDPVRSRTAQQADWHLTPRPGTDGALALGLAHLIGQHGWQDDAWLAAHAAGWEQLRAELGAYTPARVAAITGLAEGDLQRLARLYAQEKPSLIKIADGLVRNHNGGQTVRAVCALPAITGQYGRRGGGLIYSASGYVHWDSEVINKWSACPPPARAVNMNRLGAALLGEAQDPPIQSLYLFGSNPAAIAPSAGKVRAGLLREDLFTVVHELYMTDTAALADIVLPATSQLEQTDLHKAYGHATLSYNGRALPPLGESKSNWDVMGLLAAEMGFADPWLYDEPEAIMEAALGALNAENPDWPPLTLAAIRERGHLPLPVPDVPFADGRFPTPSGKVELFSARMLEMGLPPLPGYAAAQDSGAGEAADIAAFDPAQGLQLISAAAHHFVTSTFANQPALTAREGEPFVVMHPRDARRRGIADGDEVLVENGRGWCVLRARVRRDVRPGVVASPKGRWLGAGNGRNINWTTGDALGDMAGQSTFHSNRVWIRKQGDEESGR